MGLLDWLFGRRRARPELPSEKIRREVSRGMSDEELELQRLRREILLWFKKLPHELVRAKLYFGERAYQPGTAEGLVTILEKLGSFYHAMHLTAAKIETEPMQKLSGFARIVSENFSKIANDIRKGRLKDVPVILNLLNGIMDNARLQASFPVRRDEIARYVARYADLTYIPEEVRRIAA